MTSSQAAAQAADAPAIEGRNLVKSFGSGASAVIALNDVSLTVERGEFFTLLGPSGCGKTTLLRLIAGFELPSAGELRLSGRDITDLPPNRRRVNTVFQNYALFPHLTVAENIGFGLKMLGRPKAEIEARTREMIAMVQLDALADRRPDQMSGGQKQRVALARALAPSPEVLLLDEPLSALDLKLRKEMQAELKRLQGETGITFVFVTHDQEEALTMSDRIAVMSAGHVQQIGTPHAIYTRPVNRFVADFIGETNFLPARIANGIARLDVGGELALPTDLPAGAATVSIRPEHLSLAPRGEAGTLPATAAGTVYLGTDNHVHLTLGDGTPIVLRLPALQGTPPAPGTEVGLRVAPDAAQVVTE